MHLLPPLQRLNAKDVSEVIDFLKEEGQLPSIIVKDWVSAHPNVLVDSSCGEIL